MEIPSIQPGIDQSGAIDPELARALGYPVGNTDPHDSARDALLNPADATATAGDVDVPAPNAEGAGTRLASGFAHADLTGLAPKTVEPDPAAPLVLLNQEVERRAADTVREQVKGGNLAGLIAALQKLPPEVVTRIKAVGYQRSIGVLQIQMR